MSDSLKRYIESQTTKPKVEILSGAFLERIDPKSVEPVDLLTDVFGPFTYSSRPDVVLNWYLRALKKGGRVLTNEPVTFVGSNYDKKTKTTLILGADGAEASIEDWLKKGSGYALDIEVNRFGDPTYLITKTADEAYVPSLDTVSITTSIGPPMRKFNISPENRSDFSTEREYSNPRRIPISY